MKIASCGTPVDTPKLLGGGGGSRFARSANSRRAQRCALPLRGDTVIIYSMPTCVPASNTCATASPSAVYFGSPGVTLPVLHRDGGSRSTAGAHAAPASTPTTTIGGAKRFPEEHCARLEDIRAKMGELRTAAGAHPGLSLHPVQSCDDGTGLLPAEARRVHSGPPGLDQRQSARVCRDRPAPAEYADRWPEWPRDH